MSRKLPPLNGLRAFEAAARHQSFAAASDELNITQSAVSHHIRKLEEWLGVRLFERAGKGVRLTPNAERLRDVTKDALDAIQYEISRVQSPQRTGAITVQTYSTVAVLWLIPRLARFQSSHPGIDVLVNTSSSDPDLLRDQVDVAISYGRLDDETRRTGIHYDYLFTSTIFPVCHPSVLEGVGVPRLADLEKWQLLEVHSAPEDWRQWLAAAGAADMSPKRVIRFDSYLLALEAALAGQGVAIARRPFADRYLESGGLVAPFETEVEAPAMWYAACRLEIRDNRSVRIFREWLCEEAVTERA